MRPADRQDVHDVRPARVERESLRGTRTRRERGKRRRLRIRRRAVCVTRASRRRRSGTTVAVSAEADERGEHDSGDEESGCAVAPSSATRALPCLLDKRLDERLELVVRDRITRARWTGRTRRCGDAHASVPVTVALL